MWRKLGIVALALGLMWGSMVTAEEKKEESTPPVTKIVLYKHGMGYFERLGTVKDNSVIEMSFKTSQMPDLLTSLFAIDLSGKGTITTIGYDSKDPIDKQLENILIRVPENAAMTQFITQLKGARVEVRIASETARGNILGIEPVTQKLDDTVMTTYKLVLLCDDGAIKPFNLLDVATLKLLDEPIQKDLQRILDIYLKSKYTDRKTVKLEAFGKGERNILMGYLVEMPIWKTSYRLILAEKKQPYLQGWAIVENPTDEDWNDVQMSFVAGNPISFKMDLYTSYYPPRPEVGLSAITAPGDMVNFGDEEGKYEEYDKANAKGYAPGRGRMMEKSKAPSAAPGVPMIGALFGNKDMGEMMQSSVRAVATGMQIGELFAYNSQTPVSIGRRKSAMVPIVTETIDGKKVLYYRASISPRPMNALYLTNSSKLTLETGPVTFFEGSTSVGEGLLKQSLAAGMKEIIPYALETTCTVEPLVKRESRPVHKVSFANGTMVFRQFYVTETNYKCLNKSDKTHTFYLDHPRTGNYTLLEPSKPEEEIPGYYRFKMELAAGKTAEFKVIEQEEVASSIALQNLNTEQVSFYVSQPYFNKKMRNFLGEVKGIMEAIATQNRAYNDANQEYQRLVEDQRRFRENMGALNVNNPKEREIRDGYVDKLQKVEGRIAELREQMLSAQAQKRDLEMQLAKKIMEFSEE